MLSIRHATPADAARLRAPRRARLGRVPAGQLVIAEEDGRDSGRARPRTGEAVADPFAPTAHWSRRCAPTPAPDQPRTRSIFGS